MKHQNCNMNEKDMVPFSYDPRLRINIKGQQNKGGGLSSMTVKNQS